MTVDDRAAEMIRLLNGNHPHDTFIQTKINGHDRKRIVLLAGSDAVPPRSSPLGIAASILMAVVACVATRYIMNRRAPTRSNSQQHKPTKHKEAIHENEPKLHTGTEQDNLVEADRKQDESTPPLVSEASQQRPTRQEVAKLPSNDVGLFDSLRGLDSQSIVLGCEEEILQQVRVADHYQREFPDLSRAEIVGLAERTVARTVERNLSILQLQVDGSYKAAKVNQVERHHQEAMGINEKCRDYVDQIRAARNDVFWGCVYACAVHLSLLSAPSFIELFVSLESMVNIRVVYQHTCPTYGGNPSTVDDVSLFGVLAQGYAFGETMLSCSINMALLLFGGVLTSGMAIYFPRAFGTVLLLSVCIHVIQLSIILCNVLGCALLYTVISVAYFDPQLHRLHRKGGATHEQVNDIKMWAHRFHLFLGTAVLCSVTWNELQNPWIRVLFSA